MLHMPHGPTPLHHHATCQTLGVDALIFLTLQQCRQVPAVPIGRAKSVKRPAHPAVLGLFRGLRRESGRSQDLHDR